MASTWWRKGLVLVPALVTTALVGAAIVAWAPPASAASCSGPVTYSSTSNAIHLVDASRQYTLADVAAACPAAPLAQTDPTAHTWELRADLIVQNGATLQISGKAATDPVSELRLRSLSDGAFTHVSQLAASYGTIDFTSTHVRSWDDAASAPDTDPTLPPCPSGTKSSQCPRGRAYVRALSSLAADGSTWHESTLNITNSEMDHLGYYQPTAYGVSYKTESGCDRAHPSLCGHVYGKQLDSDFHDNYMGTYTWGAEGIAFLRNRYHDNTMYGLDPHDVSNDLDIEDNHFSYNGDHGLICAEACDSLRIVGNESDHNGMVPWRGPAGDGSGSNVHGIMLYRGATNAVVSGNSVHDQPNGSGIAVFDTAKASVTDNKLANNKFGIQLSVGSADNQITGNTISGGQYAVYGYRGGDAPHYTTASGRPTGNVIRGNTISGTSSNSVKLTEADQNTFSTNTISGTGSSLYFVGSVGNELRSNTLPAGQKISSVATSSGSSSTLVTDPALPVGVSVDGTSSTDLRSTRGALFAVAGRSLATRTASTGSLLHLTSTALGTTGTVTVTPQPVTVVPASGTASASATGSGTSTDVKVQESVSSALRITVSSFTAAHSYRVFRSGATIRTVTADASGVVSFTDTPPSTGPYDYTFAAA